MVLRKRSPKQAAVGSAAVGPSKAYMKLLRGEITSKQYAQAVRRNARSAG